MVMNARYVYYTSLSQGRAADLTRASTTRCSPKARHPREANDDARAETPTAQTDGNHALLAFWETQPAGDRRPQPASSGAQLCYDLAPDIDADLLRKPQRIAPTPRRRRHPYTLTQRGTTRERDAAALVARGLAVHDNGPTMAATLRRLTRRRTPHITHRHERPPVRSNAEFRLESPRRCVTSVSSFPVVP